MYGFENDYDLYPATESNVITEFFSTVWEKIKEFGRKIKEWAGKLKERIKYLLKNRADKIAENDEKAVTLTGEITTNVTNLLDGTVAVLDAVTEAYAETAKALKDPRVDFTTEMNADNIKSNARGVQDITDIKAAKDIDPKENAGIRRIYGEVIAKATEMLNDSVELITETKQKLKELSHLGRMTEGVLTKAHSDMNDLYQGNNGMAQKWQYIMRMKDATTGDLKKILGKTVSVYDAIRKCTQALMNKLISGKFAAENDADMTAKERRGYAKRGATMYKSIYKDKNYKFDDLDVRNDKNYKGQKGSNVSKLAQAYANTESAFDFSGFNDGTYDASVDDIYAAAYEAAMNDIRSFDAIPDASETFDDPFMM